MGPGYTLSATMKQLLIAAFLLVCVTASVLAASDRDLERQLKQHYVGKTLILRHPVEKDSQQYDSGGKLLSGGHEGPWTLYGGMKIRKISLKPDQLRLEGNRVFFTYDVQQTAMSYVPEDHSNIKLTVALDHPCSSLEEATKVVQSIFAVGNEDLLESAPVYWKPFLAKRLGLTWDETTGAQSGPGEKTSSDGGKIFQLNMGSGVRPPRAIYTPEPEFTQQARKHRFDGTAAFKAVVNQSGRVEHIRIVRALGMGLDEEAIDVMKRWQFRPGTLDGRPVNVELMLVVSFNLR
jgi:TonB family protein